MTNPSDDELESGISGNETWSKVCAWAVVAGLVIETILAAVYGSHASLIENWAPVFADALIALGVFGEIFFSGRVSEAEGKLRLGLKGKVAEANARAVEAQLALEKYRAPRRLTVETRSQIADKLKPFHETTFVMSAFGPEPIDLAIDTANALIAAGWQWKNWRGAGVVINLAGGHLVGSVALNGTVVKVFNSEMLAAKDALIKALDAPEFEGVRDESDNVQLGTPNDIVIMIGTKR